MKSISQHNKLSDDIIRLKFLLDEEYTSLKQIEDIIFCRMCNREGCLLDLCPHFESVKTTLINKEDRCSFPIHCGNKEESLLLATYKRSKYEEIEKIVSIIQKNIPKCVNRWHFRTKCEFLCLEIDVKKNKIYAIWTRKVYLLPAIEYKEDIFSVDDVLTDKKVPFWKAIKEGEI